MVIHFNSVHCPHLHHSIERLFLNVEAALGAQPLTSTWTVGELHQATQLLAALRLDWQVHHIRHQHLSTFEQLSTNLDAAACTVIRANLEAVRQHLASVLHDMVTTLESGTLHQ